MTDMVDTANIETPRKLRPTRWDDPQIETLTDFTASPSSWRVVEARGIHIFPAEKWTMKVTFEKRPGVFDVNDRVQASTGANLGIVDAVATTNDGEAECWVRYADGSHCTWNAGNLRHVAE